MPGTRRTPINRQHTPLITPTVLGLYRRALKLRKVESAGKYRDTIGDLNASLTKVALEELLQLDAPEYDG